MRLRDPTMLSPRGPASHDQVKGTGSGFEGAPTMVNSSSRSEWIRIDV